MHRHTRLLIAAALALVSFGAMAQKNFSDPGFWSTPTIHGYGRIHYLPKAAFKPQADATYSIVFALTKGGKTPSDVSPSLDHVARTVNLYVAAGVPESHLKFVAVAYGAATPLALDNAHYRAKFGVDNPNIKLIRELRKAGVNIAVCGQAVAEHHLKYGWISHDVTLALSGLTTVTTLEHKGYTLMPL